MPIRLSSRPFLPAPAPQSYQPIPSFESVRLALRAAWERGEGLLLLDGDHGLGKSMLALRVLADLGQQVNPIYLPSANFLEPGDFFLALLHDLEAKVPEGSEQKLFLAVQDALLAAAAAGRRTLLVLDDAHDSSHAVLDQLRRLDNLSIRGMPVVCVLLAGLPILRRKLTPQLMARIGLAHQLAPLDMTEAARFIRSQWIAAGGSDESLSDEAIAIMTAQAGGSPRVLNRLAAMALAVAQAAGAEAVDAECALEAVAEFAASCEALQPPAFKLAAGGELQNQPRVDGERQNRAKPKTRKPHAA